MSRQKCSNFDRTASVATPICHLNPSTPLSVPSNAPSAGTVQKVCFPGVVQTAGANSCDDPFGPSDNSRSIHPQTKEYLSARGVNRAQQVKPAYRRLVRQPTLDLLVGRGGHYLRGRPTDTNRNPGPSPSSSSSSPEAMMVAALWCMSARERGTRYHNCPDLALHD